MGAKGTEIGAEICVSANWKTRILFQLFFVCYYLTVAEDDPGEPEAWLLQLQLEDLQIWPRSHLARRPTMTGKGSFTLPNPIKTKFFFKI